MARKTTAKKPTVYVASYRFEDKYGESGSDILGVFSTEEKAREACGDNIEKYLGDYGAINDDGTIAPESVDSIDDDPVQSGMTLEQARGATSISIDDSGTWCCWSVDEKVIDG